MSNWSLEEEEQASSPGQMTLRGELAGRFDWDGHCVGSAEFCTTGPQGGSAWHGGFLRVTFRNSASTHIEVAMDGAEPKPTDSISITFRGDAEIAAAIESFEFLAAKLKIIRGLSVS